MSAARATTKPEVSWFAAFWRRARTAAVVSVVTVLVWIFAEAQTLRTETVTLRVTITAEHTDSNLVVRAAPEETGGATGEPAWDGQSIELVLRGATARLDSLLATVRGQITLEVGAQLPAEPGVHVVPVDDVLRLTDAFARSGVTIAKATPPRIAVQVDELTEIESPVRIEVAGVVELRRPPIAEPNHVMLRGPASLINQAVAEAGEAGLSLTARVDTDTARTLTPGRETSVPGVPLVLPAGLPVAGPAWRLRAEPPAVDVRVYVRRRLAEMTLDPMPIQVALPPGEVGRWEITLPEGSRELRGVELQGVHELLALVESGEVRPVALVRLSVAELEAGTIETQAEVLGVPEGVRVTVPDASVTLTAVRESSQSVGGPGDVAPSPAQDATPGETESGTGSESGSGEPDPSDG